jgi:transcriptional regulator with XRE-family HTH domain
MTHTQRIEAAGPPPSAQSLLAWRKRLKLRQIEAARALGISPNALRTYETGERPVPLYVALACAAIAHGLPPI